MSVNPANPPMVDASVVSRTTATLEAERNNHFIFFFSRFIPISPPNQAYISNSWRVPGNCPLFLLPHLSPLNPHLQNHLKLHLLSQLNLSKGVLKIQQPKSTTCLTPLPLHSPVLSFAQRLFMFIILFVTQILIFLCLC